MDIFINNEKFQAYFFDDEDSLLKKYSIKHNSIPEFYRFITKEYELKKDIHLQVDDIRNHAKYTIEELSKNPSILNKLHTLYPNLSKREIILLILIQYYGKQSAQHINLDLTSKQHHLRILDKSFANISGTIEAMEEFNKIIKTRYEEILKFVKTYEDYILKLESISERYTVDCENLEIEEITLDITLDINFGLGLIDIFDSIIVSKELPFVYMYYEKRLYSKVYKNLNIPSEWLEEISSVQTRLHFKILNSDVPLTEKNINKIYSNGWWDENNNVEISLSTNSSKEDQSSIQSIFFSSFGNRLGNVDVIKNDHSSIRSTFKIKNFSFNKVIFADMIDNNIIMSFFLFLNEFKIPNKHEVLTAVTKNRFMTYFNPGETGNIKNSLSVTLTPYISDDEKDEWVIVRVSKSKNYRKADTFRKIFCKLLALYLNDYDSVYKIYQKILPGRIQDLQKYRKKPKLGGKEDKKTGKRLKELKSQRPETFRSGYSGLCQPMSHQPYLIPNDKYKVIKERYGDHKVMEYKDPTTSSTDHYACEPREEGEPTTHVYPGLRKNTSKSQDYRQSVPYLPCCFTEDQYTKPASELRRVLQKKGGVSSEEDLYKFLEEENINEIGHILGYNKSVPIGRFGQLPYYMNFILKNAQYQEIEKGKQSIYPVFRYGIMQAPDSFFHCLEKIKNKRYAASPKPDRIKFVNESRKNMSNMNLAILKQEFYDYTDEDIRKILLDEKSYIDPGMWIRLAEEYYGYNIFIFQTSEDFPNGALVYPRFSKIHLHTELNRDRPTIIIMKNTTDSDWPFQCELIAKYTPSTKGKKINFYFETDDPFIVEVDKVFNRSNIVYIINKHEKIKYHPVNYKNNLFKGITSQYIDQDGKTRMLCYENGICLSVAPLPPLNVPQSSKINLSSFKQAKTFINEKKMKVEYQNENNEAFNIGVGCFSKNLTGLCYIHVYPVKDKFEEVETINLIDPLKTDNSSRLDLLNKNKRIASTLMQYTLFEYSRDPENFSEDRFTIIPNHVYDVFSLGKKLVHGNDVMYRSDKIIVNSEKMRDKLISYLHVQLLNDKFNVLEYKNRNTLKDYYKKIFDFKHSSSQNIFINYSNLEEWANRKLNKFSIKYSLIPMSVEPFFYKNYYISKKNIFLVQNTNDGSLEKALGLGWMWNKKNINLGYTSTETKDPLSSNYELYIETGLIKRATNYAKKYCIIIQRKNRYSAMLLIK